MRTDPGRTLSPLRSEIRRLTALAWPVAATQIGTMGPGVVDPLRVGNVIGAQPAVFNAVSYWLLGIPLGACPPAGGSRGSGGGLCIGLALVVSPLVVWLRFRGPAHAARELV